MALLTFGVHAQVNLIKALENNTSLAAQIGLLLLPLF